MIKLILILVFFSTKALYANDFIIGFTSGLAVGAGGCYVYEKSLKTESIKVDSLKSKLTKEQINKILQILKEEK